MLTLTLLLALNSGSLLAQASPPVTAAQLLTQGPCLDSPKSAPDLLNPPPDDHSARIVKIEKIISTGLLTPGEIIGYLYTREDGTGWLGQRRPAYMSGADSDALNRVLASTHLPSSNVTQFPPARKYGVKTNYPDTFPVSIPAAAWSPLQIQIDSCVAWPAGRPYPPSPL